MDANTIVTKRIGFTNSTPLPMGIDILGLRLCHWGQSLPIDRMNQNAPLWISLPITCPEGDVLAAIALYARYSPAYIEIHDWADDALLTQLHAQYPAIALVRATILHDLASAVAARVRLEHPGCYAYKMVLETTNTLDMLNTMIAMKSWGAKKDTVLYVSKKAGQLSQVCLPIFGAKFQEISMEADVEEGLPYAIWHSARGPMLNVETALYGLIGDPVDQSLGDVFHNAVFERESRNAVYLKQRVTADIALDCLHALAALSFYGLSVTMPLKEILAPEEDVVGAVNTFRRRQHRWESTNTDSLAAVDLLAAALQLHGAKIGILGAGGAARAIAVALRQQGAHITICNRTYARANALASMVQGVVQDWESMGDIIHDVIINTVPKFDTFPPLKIRVAGVVINIVYMHRSSSLQDFAKKYHCLWIDGQAFFQKQAHHQQVFWHNIELEELIQSDLHLMQ